MKTHEKIMVFQANVIRDITQNIFSGKEMLFGTFLMKNIFIKFPTHILKHIFWYIELKIPYVLLAKLTVMCDYSKQNI